jgi:hypothetical protein
MSYLALIKQLVTILGPLVVEIIKALKDREIRSITSELLKAKTPEEKKHVAKKLADVIYKS